MGTEIWSFKYQPKKFDEIILNPDIKPKLKKAVEEVPNMLIYGTPGVGKGTFTNVFLSETGLDYLWINASDETGIDTIRDKVKSFATSLGITPLKIVVLNESDSLSQGAQGAQKMLKQLIEDVHRITRFIFISNDETLMMDEIKSRCQVIKMDNPPAKEIFAFCERILISEGIKYDKKTVLNIVKKSYPDIRQTVWSLQENSIGGILKDSITSSGEKVYNELIKMMLVKDVEGVRKSLRSNYIHYPSLFKFLYEEAGSFKSPGDAIIMIGEHLYRDKTIAIKEINFMHMMIHMLKSGVL